MNTKLYVGNLSYDATEADLQDLFAQYGEVKDVHILMDRMSGRPRGFGFVTMATPEAMNDATSNLDNTEWMGRKLRVNEAKPRDDRPAGGGGGGGRSFQGRRGGGGDSSRRDR